MAKQTNPEKFMQDWELIIPTMPIDDIKRYKEETSPHHPNENMRWLYDRLLGELANG